MTIHAKRTATGWKATDDQYPRVYGEGETEQAAVEDLNWQILDDQDEHLQRNIRMKVGNFYILFDISNF